MSGAGVIIVGCEQVRMMRGIIRESHLNWHDMKTDAERPLWSDRVLVEDANGDHYLAYWTPEAGYFDDPQFGFVETAVAWAEFPSFRSGAR